MSEITRLSVEDFLVTYPEIAARIETRALVAPVVVYAAPQRVEGDFSIDRENAEGEAGSYVFLDDLHITGSLINQNGDFGVALIVEGKTTAQNIVAGGAFIYLNAAVVRGVVFGHYNDGMIEIRQMDADLMISDDHHMNTWPADQAKGVSVHDNPNGGISVSVDDIKLSWDAALDTTGPALADWFVDTPYTNLGEYAPADREYAILDGEYYIKWYEWVMDGIDAGAPAHDDRFARFAAHLRQAYHSAATAPAEEDL